KDLAGLVFVHARAPRNRVHQAPIAIDQCCPGVLVASAAGAHEVLVALFHRVDAVRQATTITSLPARVRFAAKGATKVLFGGRIFDRAQATVLLGRGRISYLGSPQPRTRRTRRHPCPDSPPGCARAAPLS